MSVGACGVRPLCSVAPAQLLQPACMQTQQRRSRLRHNHSAQPGGYRHWARRFAVSRPGQRQRGSCWTGARSVGQRGGLDWATRQIRSAAAAARCKRHTQDRGEQREAAAVVASMQQRQQHQQQAEASSDTSNPTPSPSDGSAVVMVVSQYGYSMSTRARGRRRAGMATRAGGRAAQRPREKQRRPGKKSTSKPATRAS